MDIFKKYKNYKLCYVDSEEYVDCPITLYFTELDDVTKQWGDDWDDRPYEHNAGRPYEYDYDAPEQGVKDGRGIYPKIDIFKVMIDGGYNIMTPRTNYRNSPYSVKEINTGIVPWLTLLNRDDTTTYVKAGTTLQDTIKSIRNSRDYVDIYAQVKFD